MLELRSEVRRVLEEFFDRVFSDVMIGYLFHGKSKQRLIEKEWEFALSELENDGPKVVYTGRDVTEVHAPLKLQRGHFDRRLQILKDVLSESDLPEEFCARWLEHSEGLRTKLGISKKEECF